MGTLLNKDRYCMFCEKTYVPIYSQPWWMDAVCGAGNWDVWLYEEGGRIAAAMPYYLEERDHGLYITKAPLTQNNGIIFSYTKNAGKIARAKFEERVIREALQFVDTLGLAVYEQQYQTSFVNWLPFYWNGCSAIPRYTYTINPESSLEVIFDGLSKSCKKKIRKGMKGGTLRRGMMPDRFFDEHEKIFAKQGLSCPFSRGLWKKLFNACAQHDCCEIFWFETSNYEVASLLFLVWDDKRLYELLGGSIPEHQSLDTYSALIWSCIEFAHKKGLIYDFEGSMIERISKSFREFGGNPELYFRIRKVYSSDVVKMESERQILAIEEASHGI